MSAKEAGLFSLQLQQIAHCKILLALMPVEPTPQVNAAQYRPILQQRLLLHEGRLHWGISLPQAERQYFLLHAPWRSLILSLIKHVTLNYKAFLTCKFCQWDLSLLGRSICFASDCITTLVSTIAGPQITSVA